MVCNLVTYRARSAVREVGYALGFPRPLVDRVAKALETYDSVMVRRDLEAEGGFGGFFARPGEGTGEGRVRGPGTRCGARGGSWPSWRWRARRRWPVSAGSRTRWASSTTSAAGGSERSSLPVAVAATHGRSQRRTLHEELRPDSCRNRDDLRSRFPEADSGLGHGAAGDPASGRQRDLGGCTGLRTRDPARRAGRRRGWPGRLPGQRRVAAGGPRDRLRARHRALGAVP